jgi:hypothetical protein
VASVLRLLILMFWQYYFRVWDQRVNHVICMVSKPSDAPEMLIATACHLSLKTKTPTKELIIDGLHLGKILDGAGS